MEAPDPKEAEQSPAMETDPAVETEPAKKEHTKPKKTWYFARATISGWSDGYGHSSQMVLSTFLCGYTLLGVCVRVLVPHIYLNITCSS